MSFSDLREPSSPLFKKWKILKIKDIVNTQNCVLVHSFLKGKLPKSFENFFQKCSEIHINPTRLSSSESLCMKPFKSVKYGLNSITNLCIRSWNTLTEILDKPSTHPISKVKQIMLGHCIALQYAIKARDPVEDGLLRSAGWSFHAEWLSDFWISISSWWGCPPHINQSALMIF